MTSARSAQGSWIASRGDGRPARIRLIEASVRSRCACHSACAIGSLVASVSVSAVAGRWRMPVPRSSRLSPSSRVGQRKRVSGNSAPSASSTNRAMPTARATNGSASHRPAQDTTRNSPTTLKSRARPGQARSHAIAYLARCRACVSCSAPADRMRHSRLRRRKAAGPTGSGIGARTSPNQNISGYGETSRLNHGGGMRHPFDRQPTTRLVPNNTEPCGPRGTP